MIRVKIYASYKFIFIILLNLIYVYLFYKLFDIDFASIHFSYMHAIFAGILIYQLSVISEKKKKPTLGYLMVYVITFYYQLSVIKYIRIGTFAGFTKENIQRFEGTILVFIILFIINILQIMKQYDKDIRFDFVALGDKKYSNFFVWGIVLFISIYYFIIFDYTNSIYISSTYEKQNILVTLFLNIITCLGVYLSIYIYDAKKIYTIIPIMLIIVSLFYYTMRIGSRALLFSNLLMIVYLFVCMNKCSVKWLSVFCIIAPWFMILITYFAFKISGRYLSDLKTVVAMNIAYRFDLSDFPLTILKNSSLYRFDLSEIKDGFLNCIPSFWTTEYKGFKSYYNMLLDCKLNPKVDYSDTFFSMGASMGGIIGEILIVPTLYCVYEYLDRKITKKSKKGMLIITLCIPVLLRIETEWITFIASIRNLIISIVILEVFYRIISKKILLKGMRI